MKEIIGLTVIIIFTSIAIGFLIAKWWIERKDKKRIKKYADEVFNVPYEVERYLRIELEPEQVN